MDNRTALPRKLRYFLEVVNKGLLASARLQECHYDRAHIIDKEAPQAPRTTRREYGERRGKHVEGTI